MAGTKVLIRVELTKERAEALALFLKRQRLDDFAAKCSKSELSVSYQNVMQSAAVDVTMALVDAGFDPRW